MDSLSAPSKQGTNDVRRVLREHTAEPALQKLIDAGCDESFLVNALHVLLDFRDPSWKALIGKAWPEFPGKLQKKLKRSLGQIRQCAGEIERMNDTPLFAMLVEAAPSSADKIALGRFRGLPELMKGYAELWNRLASLASPKRAALQQRSKYKIVAHVIHATGGSPHDEEVSALIAAVTNSEYNTDAHRQWRSENADLTKQAARRDN